MKEVHTFNNIILHTNNNMHYNIKLNLKLSKSKIYYFITTDDKLVKLVYT